MIVTGCAGQKVITEPVAKTDSVRVEYKEVVVEKIDTAYIELPAQSQAVTVRDTFSVLENDYAISRASIIAGGWLYHDLNIKTKPVPVQVKTVEIVRDTIIYKDKYIKEQVKVKQPLSAFVKVQIVGFWLLLLLIALLIIIKFK